ncbi:hypothetical protein A2841_00615 [Candidatus Kaiserbacteria bacterium RIFCSPHIGHO2_01_FULL_48_10]|uniref:Uncharacterized protein n=1 Tax=Candidatus Kaiserbacteria bacterium RIFCSPHIGHO2_01_FULL_48_10 TaxID=1798476 RepID=A0A1F6C649_9BACT|nr:MAG: hypothetical protein A2841_00615 [Candidatus Kaiserbacteria bacterium RIFCSPHIGHO2_01_FULL_48_10]
MNISEKAGTHTITDMKDHRARLIQNARLERQHQQGGAVPLECIFKNDFVLHARALNHQIVERLRALHFYPSSGNRAAY